MFKFLLTFVLVFNFFHVLTQATPKLSKVQLSTHKKSMNTANGKKSKTITAVCEEMKQLDQKKKRQNSLTGDLSLEGGASRAAEVPKALHQLEWIARAICALKRAQCNALYLTCINSGVSCTTCWGICEDLRECAIALGRDYRNWAAEGEGNRFECAEECGCIFDMDP